MKVFRECSLRQATNITKTNDRNNDRNTTTCFSADWEGFHQLECVVLAVRTPPSRQKDLVFLSLFVFVMFVDFLAADKACKSISQPAPDLKEETFDSRLKVSS